LTITVLAAVVQVAAELFWVVMVFWVALAVVLALALPQI
jgi:hypothetical protein